MKLIKLVCIILAIAVLAGGCKKTEPQSSSQTSAAKKPAKSLHQAVIDNDLEAIKNHIAQHTDIDATDAMQKTSLHYAAENGRNDVARLLIGNGAHIDLADKDGFTPLHLAVKNGRRDMAELLIDKGANVNARDPAGGTALHWAAWNEYSDIAEMLIAKGANIDVKNNQGVAPLYLASVKGSVATVKLLVGKGAAIDIFAASVLGDAERVKTFLTDKPFSANAKGPNGFTPLYCATAAGQKNIVELLIAGGADLNAKAYTGATPLFAAVWNNDVNVAEVLIAKGADLNAVAEKLGSSTPLHTASAKGFTAMAKLLVEKVRTSTQRTNRARRLFSGQKKAGTKKSSSCCERTAQKSKQAVTGDAAFNELCGLKTPPKDVCRRDKSTLPGVCMYRLSAVEQAARTGKHAGNPASGYC